MSARVEPDSRLGKDRMVDELKRALANDDNSPDDFTPDRGTTSNDASVVAIADKVGVEGRSWLPKASLTSDHA